jgi:anti-sigma regulatory factor (Ser/Thr protein kinase)
MATFERSYFSDPQAEESVLDDIQAFVVEYDFPTEFLNRFLLTLSEAFNNAAVHGNRGARDKRVFVRVTVNENAISADISDQGKGGLARVKERKPPTEMSESGRGVDLMYYYASRLDFSETAEGGLTVSFTFDREKAEVQ